jgi:nicotinamide mononucleotide (NMN) deamidase PncC
MDAAVRDLIARLHSCPYQYVLSVTGGGALAAGWLLAVPGASRTLLEVVVPYGEEPLAQFLGRRPSSFCSAETARAMAERAWARAGSLAPGATVAGVGCTASLRSDRPKRGEHRFHLAVHTSQLTLTQSLTLTKEARDRLGEEEVVDRALLNALAEAFGLSERVPAALLPGEQIEAHASAPGGPLFAFLAGRTNIVCVEPDGRARSDAPPPRVLLSGSFNPLHHGHLALADAAARLADAPAAFELAVVNADKPPLAHEEVRRRLAAFAWRAPLWLTRAPTFTEKAHLFPGAVFVVGADTAARVVEARFYGDNAARRDEALEALRARRCRFLVAGRAGPDGAFVELPALAIPEMVRDLFAAIPAEAFRADVSSTELRRLAP